MAGVAHAPALGWRTPSSSTKDASSSLNHASLHPTTSFGWQSTNTHHQLPLHHAAPSATSSPPLRAQKRRLEIDEDADPNRRDFRMDRSPTPERTKKAMPKRARIAPATASRDRDGKDSREDETQPGDDDVDVGLLLAKLPPQALLPLLTSLLSAQPNLKPLILSLIPRPTLESALQALDQSSKKLRDAYPYSQAGPSNASPGIASSSGFGNRTSTFGSSTLGFGFGQTKQPSMYDSGRPVTSAGMRDDYIVSRLRPHISDFVSTCFSYLPYFSHLPAQQAATPTATEVPTQVREKIHPHETFQFLAGLTSHLLSQPALTQSSLTPMLLPRLIDEWKAWVTRVDVVINKEAGMFGMSTVQQWASSLDAFSEAKGNGMEVMRDVKDEWARKVGWLTGRQAHVMSMDEA